MTLNRENPYGRASDESVGFPPERPDMPATLGFQMHQTSSQLHRALEEGGRDPDTECVEDSTGNSAD